MLLLVISVVAMAAASLGQCPANCRCSDYVRKTFCQGTCDSSLPEGINPNTVDLSAIGYNLTVLRRADLQVLPHLTDLSLDDNHMFFVEPDALSCLPDLVTLSMQDNLFESLDRDLIASNTNLVVLYLSQSTMLRFSSDGSFLNSASLRSLFLENCRRLSTRLDHNTSSELRVLDMRHFSGLQNLKELSLRNSGIDVLEVSTPLQPSALVSFNLRNNFLETIPSQFFAPFVATETIYLDNNKLELLPADVFEPLRSLKKLFLGNNNLEKLESGLFRSLRRLELLDLGENNLAVLDVELFRGLGSLRSLMLGGNVLESLSAPLLSPLKSLEALDVSYNKLKAVDAVWFAGLDNLDELRLAGLPMTCDCALRRFWGELQESQVQVQVVASCPTPAQLYNHTFSGLDCASTTAGLLGSSSSVLICVASVLAALLLVLGAVGAFLYCRRNRNRGTVAEDSGNAYHGVPVNEIYALPVKPSKPRPPPRPPRVLSDED